MDTKPMWYSKWITGEGIGDTSCPACGSPFPLDIAFDNAPRVCPSCKKPLVEWNFLSMVLIIDPEKAPPLVRMIVDFLAPMADYEAEETLKQVYQLFDRKSE